jgi:hypothetical protein
MKIELEPAFGAFVGDQASLLSHESGPPTSDPMPVKCQYSGNYGVQPSLPHPSGTPRGLEDTKIWNARSAGSVVNPIHRLKDKNGKEIAHKEPTLF